ncbi:hypothetical protein G7046_g630 [Stylonectria norvegica]|nr:hypothetical protein G7046_g630 [Stylonectria norvegica]
MASGVDARLLKSTKFPPEFSKKVDMQKVNLQVMKKWIASKISGILGNEDDVVIELAFNLIEGPRYPDVKNLQIQLTGFLDKDTASFCRDLWRLLLSAQGSPQGVPKELLEAKKLELIQEKIEADRAAEDARKRRDELERRDREMTNMKDRDRRDRPPPRGDAWQGRRDNRDFDGRGRGDFDGRGRGDFDGRGRGGFGRRGNRSRSPAPRYREARDPYGRDSYVPRGRRGAGRDRGTRRSRSPPKVPLSRSSSRSRNGSPDSARSQRNGQDPPRQMHIGLGKTTVVEGGVDMPHLAGRVLYLRAGAHRRPNGGGILHQEVDQWTVGRDAQGAFHLPDQDPIAAAEVEAPATAPVRANHLPRIEVFHQRREQTDDVYEMFLQTSLRLGMAERGALARFAIVPDNQGSVKYPTVDGETALRLLQSRERIAGQLMFLKMIHAPLYPYPNQYRRKALKKCLKHS